MRYLSVCLLMLFVIYPAGVPPGEPEEDVWVPPALISPLDSLSLTWGMSLDDIRTRHLENIVKETEKTGDTRAMLLVIGTTMILDRPVPSRFGLSFGDDQQLEQIATMFNTWTFTPEEHVMFFATICRSLQSTYGKPDVEGKAWSKNEPVPEMDPLLAIFSGMMAMYSEWVLDETLVTVIFKGNGQMFYVVVFYEDLSKNPDRMSELYPQLPAEVLKL